MRSGSIAFRFIIGAAVVGALVSAHPVFAEEIVLTLTAGSYRITQITVQLHNAPSTDLLYG
jgi:hypothetical protein